MRLGIVSDTHGNILRTAEAVEIFQERRIEAVVHCGDIGGAAIVRLLNHWPAHYVLGNVDDRYEVEHAIAEAGHTLHGRFGFLEIEGKRIAFLHGDDARLLRDTIADGQWNLVCHGHTHVARQFSAGPTHVLNPGALHRTSQPSVAVVDVPSLRATIVSLPDG